MSRHKITGGKRRASRPAAALPSLPPMPPALAAFLAENQATPHRVARAAGCLEQFPTTTALLQSVAVRHAQEGDDRGGVLLLELAEQFGQHELTRT